MRKILHSLTAGLLFLSISGSFSPGQAFGMECENPDAFNQDSTDQMGDANLSPTDPDVTEDDTASQDEETTVNSDSTIDQTGTTTDQQSTTNDQSTVEGCSNFETTLPNEELLSTIAGTTNSQFKDVDEDYRASAEIYYLVSGGIIYGTSPDTFSPNRNVTRAEAAAMIGRMLSLNGEKRKTEFPDVGSGSFASGYIQGAANLGIISGYKDGSFKPEKSVKRGEMAIMIARALKYEGATSIDDAAEILMEKGIAQGFSDGTFGKSQYIIRADFSVFLARGILVDLRTVVSETFDKNMLVYANDLNVRTGPTTKFPKITQLQPTTVKTAYKVGDWYYITWAEGETGFVHGDYLAPESMEDIVKVLQETHIIVDAGHGYPDPGSNGFGIHEKDIVLDVANRVESYIQQTPLAVSLTRKSDRIVSLEERVKLARDLGGDLFVSIHTNALNGTANGTETYYYRTASTNPYTSESRALATYIHNRLLNAWGLVDRGVKHGDFHVIRENTMPAVLLELGFIDNKGDNAKISSPTEREKAAEAIFFGILDYYYHYEGLDIQFLYTQMNGSPSPRLH